MGRPAARIGDMHTCPLVNPGPVPHVGGPVAKGLPTVLTCGSPQARVTDMAVCVGPPDAIARGSATVLVGSLPAARMGDQTVHGGVIVAGAPTVLIGDGGGEGPGGSDMSMIGAAADGLDAPGDQAKALIAAARSGLPFCEICGR